MDFTITSSTSTTLCVELRHDLRFYAQRHSDRRTGSSIWETWFEQYGKWKVRQFGETFIEEKWSRIKANTFRGVRLVKSYSYKKDILIALESVPKSK